MKNKIFCFVLDLFKNGDKEEQAGIFAQVKIYRSTSARVFEFIVGILVLAMWLLTIRNIIHATSDDLPYLLLLAGMGTFFPIACLLHSYHPKANDFPFVKIVNARQVYYLSLLDRYAALPADLGLYAKDIKWIFKRNPRHSNGSRYRLGMQEILRPFP